MVCPIRKYHIITYIRSTSKSMYKFGASHFSLINDLKAFKKKNIIPKNNSQNKPLRLDLWLPLPQRYPLRRQLRLHGRVHHNHDCAYHLPWAKPSWADMANKTWMTLTIWQQTLGGADYSVHHPSLKLLRTLGLQCAIRKSSESIRKSREDCWKGFGTFELNNGSGKKQIKKTRMWTGDAHHNWSQQTTFFHFLPESHQCWLTSLRWQGS